MKITLELIANRMYKRFFVGVNLFSVFRGTFQPKIEYFNGHLCFRAQNGLHYELR